MIKRAHIRQFLALVDEGNFTHAAHRLRVTQPTLSTGIAELERLVGSALFLRERRKVRLTDAGGRFLAIARELEQGFRTADQFCQSQSKEWPELRIGVLQSIGSDLLAKLVGQLSQDYSLELMEGQDSELRSALTNGRVQLAITLLRQNEVGEGALSLIEEPYVMLARHNHALAGKPRVKPEELAAEIMIARRSCEFLEGTSRFFSQRGVRPRFALRSANDDRCMAMVSAGLGITTAPLSFARKDMSILAVEDYIFSRHIGILMDANWQADFTRVQYLLEMVQRIRDESIPATSIS